jgi:hypothetical protein
MNIDRRSLFAAAAGGVAAVSVGSISSAVACGRVPCDFRRISTEPDDPGYRAFCQLRGDDIWPVVYLDGVEEKHCVTVDAKEGWVKRAVLTPRGNIAHDGNKILHEIVYGHVVIEIPPSA